MIAARIARTMLRKIAALRRAHDGVAAIEFAFAAPVIVGFLMVLYEAGHQGAVRIALEATLASSARESITGNIATEMQVLNLTREQVLRKRVRDKLSYFRGLRLSQVAGQENPKFLLQSYASSQNGGGFGTLRDGEPLTDINGNGVCDLGPVTSGSSGVFQRETFQDANGSGKWEGPNDASGLGGPGDIVSYQVTLKSPLFFTALKAANNNKDDLELKSVVVLQNESYDSAQANSRIRKYCDGTPA